VPFTFRMSGVRLPLRTASPVATNLIPLCRRGAPHTHGEGEARVHLSRFVFLSMPVSGPDAEPPSEKGVVWMLVSPNNRPRGSGGSFHETYATCRDAVLHMRESRARIKPLAYAAEASGQWTWRIDLDGDTVAVSSRSYLRVRECNYNLERFLCAVPTATIVAGTRSVRGGRRLAGVRRMP
jgi:hypothetical protein